MSDGFIVKPLRCGHCGNELPVMGQFVTFQCPTCFRYWILTLNGLEPVTVFEAVPPQEAEKGMIPLPFWVTEIDCDRLRGSTNSVMELFMEKAQAIMTMKLDNDDFQEDLLADPDLDRGLLKAQMLKETSSVEKIPTSSEINYVIRRIEQADPYHVYVPAFLSRNTYAYLKVGRLLTKCQPRCHIEKSTGLRRTVLCALQADEALELVDFVFFATLPESIRNYGNLLERIHLHHSGRPRLVEFPFERNGAYLKSLVGEFTISCKLVDHIENQQTTYNTTT